MNGGLVLGYHGCDETVGEALLAGGEFRPSRNAYDWLGQGVYFWENNPVRALNWARFMAGQKKFQSRVQNAFAVGAVINLGKCLDLTESGSLASVREAYESMKEVYGMQEIPMPENLPSHTSDEDMTKRNLDCAVINFLHFLRKNQKLEPFDTVRAAFTEGGALYPGARFQEKTHIQIAVINLKCIHGVFRLKPEHLLSV